MESRSINTQKKNEANDPTILTAQAWSIRDLLYGFPGKFSLWDAAGSPERAR